MGSHLKGNFEYLFRSVFRQSHHKGTMLDIGVIRCKMWNLSTFNYFQR